MLPSRCQWPIRGAKKSQNGLTLDKPFALPRARIKGAGVSQPEGRVSAVFASLRSRPSHAPLAPPDDGASIEAELNTITDKQLNHER